MNGNSDRANNKETEQETPNSLILGTAGHIDHGKSSLIKALTGTDPDRLAEEKRRGITIELGFAELILPSGRHMGVVDVPGHEKFVRHMVAGATGVDVALLVIAADDGIMPQTIEHTAVLELLGVKSCVVALTKTDLVDKEWLSFVTDDIKAFLADGSFADAPIIAVSSRTGEGLDELKEAIDQAASQAKHTKSENAVRMPIDRVFTIRGFGTVVTGTLWSGTLTEGDELVVLPDHLQTRARSIQIHGNSVDCAQAGNRVAVCLHNLSTDEVHPGDFLAAPEVAQISDRFDAEFTYLDPFAYGTPLKSGARIHVAHGTREVLGRILFMDGTPSLSPGERSYVQIRLEEPLPVAYRDQFIVRSYSPMHVIGGGIVLTPNPRRRTNLKPEEHALLEALESGNIDGVIGAHLELAQLPETAEEIARACGIDTALTETELSRMADEARVVTLGTRPTFFARGALLQKILSNADHALLEFHTDDPNATGMSKESLRQLIAPSASAACFDAIVEEALKRDTIVQSDGELSHPQASVGAREQEKKIAEDIEQALQKAGDAPPEIAELAQKIGVDESLVRKVASRLARENRIVRVDTDRYYERGVIDRFRKNITDYINTHGEATAAELKDTMGISRKYAMPLLEYFDSVGLTRRNGDTRSLV